MAPTIRSRRQGNDGTEKVRHELLLALHVGRLSPGGRAPSVRRLASKTGMNRKTVHRAYTRLADEGLLDLRPGSGTFITERLGGTRRATAITDLVSALNRCRAMGEGLGLSPATFASCVEIALGGGLTNLPLAVAECNTEQARGIARELNETLGVDSRPCLLADLSARPRATTAGVWGVVTTDCHGDEVRAIGATLGLPVYRVALDAAFPQRVLDLTRSVPVVVVVEDARFDTVFRRLLAQLEPPQAWEARLRVVEPARLGTALREFGDQPVAVQLSVLVDPHCLGALPAHVRVMRGGWRIDAASLQRLRARLALDLAARRRDT